MVSPGRNERRKAETRAKIIRAAQELFGEKGYAATSMEDISTEADVAIRTIYLHFESKAAVLLAFFDDWMDEFVRLVGERTADERLDQAVDRALRTMKDAGWNDDARIEDVQALHPVPEFVGGGSPEVAGHILQRWVAAQETLTERFRATLGLPADSLLPQLEATAVFASWFGSVFDFRARFARQIPGDSSHDVGRVAIRAYVEGLANQS